MLFGVLCLVYWRVPRGPIPWRCVWPGALGAVVAMGVIDYVFPLYLSNVSSLRVGTSFLFVLIVLVWFYVLALILLAGAVINELRFESAERRLHAMADPKTEELRVEQIQRERDEHARAREADQRRRGAPARAPRRARGVPAREARRARGVRGTGRGRRMTEDHRQQADAAERELADMEERGAARRRAHRRGAQGLGGEGRRPVRAGRRRATPDDSAESTGEGELPPPDPHETD